ncbi:G2/M phase-specific E3 ubiquitin-protein ligase-like [Oncorhynchus masou masou]|uniref:G2/M phase-specific E3 ubiquitin-protein ligase-like n=1 Tax=Oncorhynchus masou masou TaxID=90313 RepID=UPI0031832735
MMRSCVQSIWSSTAAMRNEEELVVGFWKDWLIDVEGIDAFIEPEEGGETIPRTLEGVLVFATGASKIPPFGFDDRPTIEFLH